jgi:hypothetical protein
MKSSNQRAEWEALIKMKTDSFAVCLGTLRFVIFGSVLTCWDDLACLWQDLKTKAEKATKKWEDARVMKELGDKCVCVCFLVPSAQRLWLRLLSLSGSRPRLL